MATVADGLSLAKLAIVVNLVLAVVKITAGVCGKSYALIADGIESTTDIVTSLIVWSALRIAAKPPDPEHPYGHGKAESLAGVVAALFLLGSAALLAVQSVREIRIPHHAPAWYTLVVLFVTIVVKETLYRAVFATGKSIESIALKNDAWHHRSDALTSLAAFVGISVALIGGTGFEEADDWGALFACSIIAFNGLRLLRPALNEVMDAQAPPPVERQVRAIAEAVPGVTHVEKCRIRKSGFGWLMDIHVTVNADLTVRAGHDIGHAVKDHLMSSSLRVHDVVVHLEPDGM